MPKAHTFRQLFEQWQKSKIHADEVKAEEKHCKPGTHAYSYWQKYVKDAERAEKYWLEKMGEYGKGVIIQVTGLIKSLEKPVVIDYGLGIKASGPQRYDPFTIYLINASTEEVKEYLIARFPLIEKGTIELQEFQTGILIV